VLSRSASPSTWRPKGEPEEVRVYDFKDKSRGKGTPYGVYDVTSNQGWVSVCTDHEVMVNLIGSTATGKGLKVRAELDENEYQTGIKVSDKELADVNIERDNFHGEWNYKICP